MRRHTPIFTADWRWRCWHSWQSEHGHKAVTDEPSSRVTWHRCHAAWTLAHTSTGCRWSARAAHGNGDTAAATWLYVPPPRKYLLSLLYLGGPSFLLRFEYSLCSSLTITGSVRGSFQVSRMDNKGKIRWDNGIINVISVKKENRDEASIFKLHWSWLAVHSRLCNRVEVWDRLMLPVILFLCVVLYHGVSQQQPAPRSNGWNKADISCYHCLILTIKLCWKQSLPEYRIQNAAQLLATLSPALAAHYVVFCPFVNITTHVSPATAEPKVVYPGWL